MDQWFKRPGKKEDIAFIYSTWMECLKYNKHNHFSSLCCHYPAIIDMILLRPQTIIDVACLPEDKDTILGYLVTEKRDPFSRIIHFSFTKMVFTKRGIFNSLISGLCGLEYTTVYYTHKTEKFKYITDKHVGWIYDPTKVFIKECEYGES